MKKAQELIKRYSIHGLIVLVFWGSLTAPYIMYIDNQKQMNVLYEAHRPILTIDTNIDFSDNMSPILYVNNQLISFNLIFNVHNIGDRPAYQSDFNLCAAPSSEPDKLKAIPDTYQTNPIYMGTANYIRYNYFGSYTQEGNNLNVLIYSNIKYSDSESGGNIKNDPYWWMFTFNRETLKTALISVKPGTIEFFKPYITKLYAKYPNGGN